MTPLVEWLLRDHEGIGALLDRADGSGVLDAGAFEEFRARLLRHIAIEEKIVFARAARARGAPLARAAGLRREHAALTSLLVPSPDLALVGELRGLLASHDAVEEGPGGVYQECEEALGDAWRDVLDAVVARRQVRVARHFDGRGTVRTAAEALRRAGAFAPAFSGDSR